MYNGGHSDGYRQRFGYNVSTVFHTETSDCSEALPFVIVKTSNTTADIQTCQFLNYETQTEYMCIMYFSDIGD